MPDLPPPLAERPQATPSRCTAGYAASDRPSGDRLKLSLLPGARHQSILQCVRRSSARTHARWPSSGTINVTSRQGATRASCQPIAAQSRSWSDHAYVRLGHCSGTGGRSPTFVISTPSAAICRQRRARAGSVAKLGVRRMCGKKATAMRERLRQAGPATRRESAPD